MADSRVHRAAMRIARQCRFTIQACLREEEWGDADREFYAVAHREIEALLAERAVRRPPPLHGRIMAAKDGMARPEPGEVSDRGQA